MVAGVYLYKNTKDKYDQLHEQKDGIEDSFNEDLEWENNPDKQTAVIKIEKPTDMSNENDWSDQHE